MGKWCGLNSYGSGQRPLAGCCEQGNEPSGSIMADNFLPYWNYIDRKLLICPPELSDNTTSSHLVLKQEELEKKINLTYGISLSYFERFFNIP
jgi:hypothetical protein